MGAQEGPLLQDALQVLLQMKHDCPPLRMKSLCWDRRISRESGKELKEFRAAWGGGGLKRTQAHKSEFGRSQCHGAICVLSECYGQRAAGAGSEP